MKSKNIDEPLELAIQNHKEKIRIFKKNAVIASD